MTTQLAEIGIVHGAGFLVTNEGVCASQATEAHALRAAELLNKGIIERVICSGLGPLELIEYGTSEAQLMADSMVAGGIPAAKIDIENRSTSTLGNHVLSVPIIRDYGAERVIGITSKSHVPRALALGSFVAKRTEYQFEGYVPVPSTRNLPKRVEDYAREGIMRAMTWVFIQQHPNTPLDKLLLAYDEFKEQWKLGAAKRRLHQSVTDQ